MRFKKAIAAFMSAVLLLGATGCTAEARNNKAREAMEDVFESYMAKVLAGKDASKYVDAKKEAEYDVTSEQAEILKCVLKNAEFEIKDSEAVAKDKEGSITIEFHYADAQEMAESYFDDELDELLEDIADSSKKFYLKKKIKVDLVQDGDNWLVTKKSDAKLKQSLMDIVKDIYLEPYYSTAVPTPTPAPGTKPADSKKIGISLPTMDLMRWKTDGDYMRTELELRGYEVDLQYANNMTDTQRAQIMNLTDSGCSVLIVAAIDPASLSYELEEARKNGITVIAYDRLVYNTTGVDYYVTFDQYMTGVIQGQYIAEQLKLDSAPAGKVFNIEITAGDPMDEFATYFYRGAFDVLSPYIESGVLKVPSGQTEFTEVATEGWFTDKARGRAEYIIGMNYSDGEVIDAWLCSNDSTALGVAQALEASAYKGPYPIITGQDCNIENVRNIINGKQAMSVFKDTRIIAERAVTMADQLLAGKDVECNDAQTYNNGVKIVPAYLCKPVYADASNYKAVLIDSGYYTEADLI